MRGYSRQHVMAYLTISQPFLPAPPAVSPAKKFHVTQILAACRFYAGGGRRNFRFFFSPLVEIKLIPPVKKITKGSNVQDASSCMAKS